MLPASLLPLSRSALMGRTAVTKTMTAVSLPTVSLVRHKGHSKWANIKHTKAAEDTKKGMMAKRYGEAISMAVKEANEADPKRNRKLDRLIQEAIANNMTR